MIQFPSYEKALEWYHSEAYKPIRQIRLDNAETNAIIIQGAKYLSKYYMNLTQPELVQLVVLVAVLILVLYNFKGRS